MEVTVYQGAVPASGLQRCTGASSTTATLCAVSNPAAGTYTILLTPSRFATLQTFSAVTMEVNPTLPTVSLGQSIANLSSASGAILYTVTVPAGTPSLLVRTSGGSGSMEVTVYQGAAPAWGFERCTGTSSTTATLCAVNNPAAGTYTILLTPYRFATLQTFSGVMMAVNPPL